MQITNKIKAAVFSPFIGQQFIFDNQKDEIETMDGISTHIVFSDSDDSEKIAFPIGGCKLLLTPVHKISNEDAIIIAKMLRATGTDRVLSIIGKRFIDQSEISLECLIPQHVDFIYQYLRSIGYDTPQHLLGGNTLIEMELSIDKTILK